MKVVHVYLFVYKIRLNIFLTSETPLQVYNDHDKKSSEQ